MTLVTPDFAASLAWLRWLYPLGPWVLTAIEPDTRGIETATFRPETESACEAWIRTRNVARNVYYHVNRPLRDLTKKAERTDIAAVHFLHVDVDPRAIDGSLSDEEKRAHLAAEQVRIEALLSNPPGGIPRPSALIYSGGGYNALWRLAEPIVIDGKLEAAEAAARYNLQLEATLGGDNCHNIDRILRVPGTTNWPDARKRRKGRVATVARVVFADDVSCPLSMFVSATPLQRPDPLGTPGLSQAPRIQISGNVRRYAPDELPETVSGKVRELLVHGIDPDEPTKYASRSEALWRACCALAKAGLSKEMVYAIITDPDYRISESVLEARGGAERYALRQIERAFEEAIHPWLRSLNEKHAVIANMGGKCRVVEEIEDHAMSRSRLTKQSFEDFRNRYMHEKIDLGVNPKGEPVRMAAGNWWLNHQQRRQYSTIVFSPEHDVEGAYNLWRGFACEARPGDKHEGLLRHVHENVCAGVEEYYRYLLGWMARCVQTPATPGEVAVVMRGAPGTGKGLLAREYGKLWGRHFLQVSDPKHLVGSFNAHLRDCIVLFGDEAFYAGDKKHESMLKTLITEDTLMVEAKGIDAESANNYVHIMMASNSNWVIPADLNERRYFVLDVSAARMQDTAYFAPIMAAMDDGGRENLLHYLKTYDLSGYDVRDVPKTDALRDQKTMSFTSEEEWWFGKLYSGILLAEHVDWRRPIRWDLLLDDYYEYAQRVGVWRKATETAMRAFVKRAIPGGAAWCLRSASPGGNIGTYLHVQFPSVDVCRARWDAEFGGPYSWDDLVMEPLEDRQEPF